MINLTMGTITDFDTYILDTSVVINLHKSDFGLQVVQSLPGKIVITQDVKSELNQKESLRYDTFDFLNLMLNFENVELAKLNHWERVLKSKLLNNESSPIIDRGEASVIAISRYSFSGRNCTPIIDEVKGRTVAESYLQGKECGYSLDLFFHPAVLSSLGDKSVSDAVYNSLVNARMSIPRNSLQEVIDFIGLKRARKCKSLPGYKKLFP